MSTKFIFSSIDKVPCLKLEVATRWSSTPLLNFWFNEKIIIKTGKEPLLPLLVLSLQNWPNIRWSQPTWEKLELNIVLFWFFSETIEVSRICMLTSINNQDIQYSPSAPAIFGRVALFKAKCVNIAVAWGSRYKYQFGINTAGTFHILTWRIYIFLWGVTRKNGPIPPSFCELVTVIDDNLVVVKLKSTFKTEKGFFIVWSLLFLQFLSTMVPWKGFQYNEKAIFCRRRQNIVKICIEIESHQSYCWLCVLVYLFKIQKKSNYFTDLQTIESNPSYRLYRSMFQYYLLFNQQNVNMELFSPKD